MSDIHDQLPAAPPLFTPPEPTKQQTVAIELGGSLDALTTCRYCWGHHPGVCPFIKLVEWHPQGQIARVVLKERPKHEDLIVYPLGDETTDLVLQSLQAIAAADSLERAKEIALTLIKLMTPEEKPS